MPSDVIHARSRLGVAVRTGDKQAADEARRELATAKIEAAIEASLATAPPLTASQKYRIAEALRARPEAAKK